MLSELILEEWKSQVPIGTDYREINDVKLQSSTMMSPRQLARVQVMGKTFSTKCQPRQVCRFADCKSEINGFLPFAHIQLVQLGKFHS